MIARYGASRKTHLSAVVGRRLLLEEELDAVGEALQQAERPGAVGADAVLHLGDDLAQEPDVHQHREQQQDEDRDRLADHDEHDREVDVAVEQRVGAHVPDPDRVVSTRRSVTASVTVTRSLGPTSPGWATAMNAVPGAVAASVRTAIVTVPRGLVTRTSSPSAATPMRLRSLGCTTSAAPGASARERRARCCGASGVVQRAGGHEAETVRVDGHALRLRCDAVPGVERRRAAAVSAAASTTRQQRRGRARPRRCRARLDRGGGAGAALGHRAGAQRRQCVSSDAIPGRIGSQETPAVKPCEAWSTISSGNSLIGSTAPSRARRMQRGVDAGVRGRDARDLVLHVFDGLEAEVDTEAQRELGCDAPVGHRGAVGRHEPRQSQHATLEVGGAPGLLAPHRHGEEHVGALGGVGGERADRDHEAAPCRARARTSARSGKSATRSAPRSTSVSMVAGGGRGEHAGGVEPAARRARVPTRRRSCRGRRRA